jgi:hypothetical protein
MCLLYPQKRHVQRTSECRLRANSGRFGPPLMASMGVDVQICLRFVFLHDCMTRRGMFGFRNCCRDLDVARAGLGALACRRTDRRDGRAHQNYASVYPITVAM